MERGAEVQHPIALVNTDDLRRNRVTVFFRLLLAIPHLIWLALWGIIAYCAVFVAWLIAIFAGRVPDGLHDFLASYLRYTTHVYAFTLLLADPFPGFSGSDAYPIDVVIAPAAPQRRLTVFFRILLAIPAMALTYVFRLVNQVIGVLSWFYALFTGSMHEGLRNTSTWLLRYEVQTYGYIMLLTGRYPTLAGAPSA
ncbi:MAG: DUF4389 domain-containing protein [Gaiellaceae bacterium]